MKFKEKCPYCKESSSTFEYNQIKPLSLHIRSHREIPLDERKEYLEKMKQKLRPDTTSKTKIAKKTKPRLPKKKRDWKLTFHRKTVLSILKDIGVEDFHIENVNRAGNISAIDKYLRNELKPYHEEIKKKKMLLAKKKANKKKNVQISVKVIYTPMGNKR